MVYLDITKVKYPKNDTIGYEYESLDNLLMELKQMIINNQVGKDDIIRINASKVVNKNEILKEKLNKLVEHNYLFDYKINNDEITIRYGLSSVGDTERVFYVDDNKDLKQALLESSKELRADIEYSLDEDDDEDFFGYDSKEELEDRIAEETDYLKLLSTLV